MQFFRWWIRQLAGLVSARLLPSYLKNGEAALLQVADDAFVLQVRRRGKTERVAEGPLADLKPVLASIDDLPRLKLLTLPPQQVLRKRIWLPLAVRRNLKSVLGFEIDRETPFEPAEVYWTYSLAGQPVKDQMEIDLLIVPRPAGDGLAQVARDHGFAPAALEVANQDRPSSQLWLEAPDLLDYVRLPARREKAYLAAVCGVAAVLLLLPFAIQQARLYLADRTVAALEDQARTASALDRAANRRMSALTFMGQSHPGHGALEILASASRALPDDSFLTSFRVHGSQVSMAGSSQAAAKLIGALARSGSFRDPVFDAAVLQAQGDDQEKFTISARLADTAAP